MARMASVAHLIIALGFSLLPQCLSDAVLQLTERNFFEEVSTSLDRPVHFVMFYGPWCEHCQSLLPKWQRLGKHYERQSRNHVTVAQVDCTQETFLCARLNIKAYPTLRLYYEGTSKRYNGKRKVEDFTLFVEETVFKKGEDVKSSQAESQKGLYILTDSNFDDHVAVGLHFVKFYAPWCGHCRRLAPTWQSLAEFHKDSSEVTIGKIDCTQNPKECNEHGVHGFPTLKLFKDGREVDSYERGRTLEALLEYVQEKITEHNSLPSATSTEEPESEELLPPPDPVEDSMIKASVLNDDNFDTVVSFGTTFVNFYAPWCKHCQKLAPVWDELANRCADQTAGPRIAKVDCTQEENLCSRFEISGYPTLILFRNGERVEYYNGAGELDSLYTFVMRRHEPEL